MRDRGTCPELLLGMLLGLCYSGTIRDATTAPVVRKAPGIVRHQQRSRVVVGLKDPLTPPVIKELQQTFGPRILNIAPGGAYALVLLRPGETLEEVQAKSARIAWVEPEVVMGAAKEARQAVVVIPAPRWPKGKN